MDETRDNNDEGITIGGWRVRFYEEARRAPAPLPDDYVLIPEFAIEDSYVDENGVRVITKARLSSVGIFPRKRKEAP